MLGSILTSWLRRSLVAAIAAAAVVTVQPGVAVASVTPDDLGHAVTDVDAARAQLAAATGTTFGPTTRSTEYVWLTDREQLQRITLRRTVSARGGPFLELVQASPAIGPWAARSDRAVPFLSYSVDDVSAASRVLAAAGMTPLAIAHDFVYLRGTGGQFIRLIDRTAMPARGTNEEGTTVDLGPPVAAGLYPCDVAALKRQLAAATGITWREPQSFTLPWELSDGTTRVVSTTATISQTGEPFVNLETPHGFPLEDSCTATHTPEYLVFVADDVSAAEAQLAAAGMRFVARVPTLIGAYRGTGGVSVQVVSPAFVPAPM